ELLYDSPQVANWGSFREKAIKRMKPALETKVRELHDIGVEYAAATPEKRTDPKFEQARKEVVELSSEAVGKLDEGAEEQWKKGNLFPTYKATLYHVDHIKPLAQHWVEHDWDSDDASRKKSATDDSNLQLLTETWNTSKGGAGYHYQDRPYVGPNF